MISNSDNSSLGSLLLFFGGSFTFATRFGFLFGNAMRRFFFFLRPGFRGKNGRRIRTQRGPLTPKPPSDFS